MIAEHTKKAIKKHHQKQSNLHKPYFTPITNYQKKHQQAPLKTFPNPTQRNSSQSLSSSPPSIVRTHLSFSPPQKNYQAGRNISPSSAGQQGSTFNPTPHRPITTNRWTPPPPTANKRKSYQSPPTPTTSPKYARKGDVRGGRNRDGRRRYGGRR